MYNYGAYLWYVCIYIHKYITRYISHVYVHAHLIFDAWPHTQ